MRIIVGLPALSRGPLLDAAQSLKMPVMISANALAKWSRKRGTEPDFLGWRTSALDRAANLATEIHIDSAGFVAMALKNGYDWSVASYIEGLCAHPAITRFSAMDLCVESAVAPDRAQVEERLAKTVNLNWSCYRIARDIGIAERLMPVIQGARANDYLRVFDRISGMVPAGSTIGVGSMCRRATNGADGAIAILQKLDRELPANIRLHLFGLKSDAAEAACMFGERIDSVDSQAYGTRARFLAGERRKSEPGFSKSNAFTANVMIEWIEKQRARIADPRPFHHQMQMDVASRENRTMRIVDALEDLARAQINELIEAGDLEHDQLVGGRLLEEWISELASRLPKGLSLSDPLVAEIDMEDLLAA